MSIRIEEINKYSDVVLNDRDTSALVEKTVQQGNHCILLQCEDSLHLDVFSFLLIKKILQIKGGDFTDRLVSNSIPDIIFLPKGEKVLTEDIEHIASTAFLTSIEFDTKIYIIDKCETMNEAAQNKLLKLLEEPPRSTRFILKCTSKFALLPTVRSRSELIEIPPLDTKSVLDALPDTTALRQRQLIAATSFGRLDYTEKILSDGNYILLEDLAFEVFSDLKRSGDMAKVAYKILKLKDYLETLIFYLECILHDCTVFGLNEKQRIYFVYREREIANLSKEYTPEVTLKLSQSILKSRQRLKSYGNVTGIVDELLFSMLEVKAKWQKL